MNGMRIAIGLIIAFIAGVAGYELGLTQTIAAGGAAVPVAPYYFAPYHFGFFGLLFPLLFVFLIFGLGRALFWGGHGYRRGPWADREAMLDDWHKRQHGDPTPPKS